MPPSPEAKTNERPPQTPDQSSRLAIASSGGAALANDRIGDQAITRPGNPDERKRRDSDRQANRQPDDRDATGVPR